MSALDLNYISPLLLKAQNLEVCVPGKQAQFVYVKG